MIRSTEPLILSRHVAVKRRVRSVGVKRSMSDRHKMSGEIKGATKRRMGRRRDTGAERVRDRETERSFWLFEGGAARVGADRWSTDCFL